MSSWRPILPGYASSAPANNRLAFNVTTLTTSTNNNFFQYHPAPSVYSTISGTVWYDANGNGTNNVGETNLANVEIDLVQDVNTNGIADSGEPVVASVNTDTNGNYSFAGVTPGHYVIREIDTLWLLQHRRFAGTDRQPDQLRLHQRHCLHEQQLLTTACCRLPSTTPIRRSISCRSRFIR